jgi:hypothetical protein
MTYLRGRLPFAQSANRDCGTSLATQPRRPLAQRRHGDLPPDNGCGKPHSVHEHMHIQGKAVACQAAQLENKVYKRSLCHRS